MNVMKFGGSSLADADALARVAGIIVSRAHVPLVVVVSAMGNTTDRLVEIAAAAAEGRRADATKAVDELEKYHLEEAAAAVRPDAHPELKAFLETHFRELREMVGGLATLGELTPQSADAVTSFGERLSSFVVTLPLRRKGLRSGSVDRLSYRRRESSHGSCDRGTWWRAMPPSPPRHHRGITESAGQSHEYS